VARAGNKDDLASGKLKIVMQLGLDKHKELPDIPMLKRLRAQGRGPAGAGPDFSPGRRWAARWWRRPALDPRVAHALAPGIRRGMRDPQFIAEGARMNLELEFVGGDAVQKLVERLYQSAPT
jgi:hypothetical protein